MVVFFASAHSMNLAVPHSSRRLAAVQSPIIPVIAGLVRQHPGTLSLGQGVVHYGPPLPALAAARGFGDLIEDHLYGPVQGQPELLEEIARKLAADNNVTLGASQNLMVTAGSNMAFLNAILAIADPGDEILLPRPWYFNQEMAIRMIGCIPVGVPTDDRHQLQLEALRAAVTPRTRAIVTVSPNNPTGAVYPEADLRAVNALCAEHGLYHISDEAYEYFVWDGARHFSPASIAGAEAHTLALYSLSKAYGFASWRIGYMVIPQHLNEAVLKVQDTNLICAPRISQVAAMAALRVGKAHYDEHRPVLARVRECVLEELDKARSFCRRSEASGAFYSFLELDTPVDSQTVAERLIREHGVAVIPGNAFGLEKGCTLRVSFGALKPATAEAAVRRLTAGLTAVVHGG
jgi:aspartate/methionine/tyrosine aminotransferase